MVPLKEKYKDFKWRQSFAAYNKIIITTDTQTSQTSYTETADQLSSVWQ